MALAVLYVVLPYNRIAGIIYVFAAVIAAIGIAAAVFRRWHSRTTAWILIAGALALAAIGHAIWYWFDLRGLEPFPSSADTFYLAVYPLLMAALWLLGSQNDERDDGSLSDALIVGTSAAVIGWVPLIAPYMQDPSLSLSQLLVSVAYPVFDLILLTMLLRLVFLQKTRILAHHFLLLGMLAYLTADLLYAHGNLVGWYAPGGFTDGLWLLAYALFVAAAWHPSAMLEPFVHTSNVEQSRRSLLVPGVASALVPTIVLVTAEQDPDIVKVGAIATIVLLLLLMYRMDGLLKETHRQSKALERLARLDPLTGAANRRQLNNELAREMARAERTGAPLTLAILDLDHFKLFNDTHGHSAGDALLQQLVTAWQQDMRPSDVLARFGGEEFVVVLPETDMESGSQVSERLRRNVPKNQTCSVGLAVFQLGESADAFIHRADEALYAAKDAGRNRTVCA